MRAAFVERFGPADSICVGDLPVPAIGPTDVLVAVELTAVDAVDTYIRSGRRATPVTFPFVVGRDLLGTVASASAGSGFAPGERVWCNSLGHCGRQGSFAELAVVPADRLYRLPAGADPTAAVACLHPAATAYLSLFHHARMRPIDTVLVGGGAGSVGTAAIQLASAAGARVMATALPPDHDRCRRSGAGAVFDYRNPAMADVVRRVAPDGVDVYWDTSGHHDLVTAAAVAAPRGRVLLTAQVGEDPPLPVLSFSTGDVALVGFNIDLATTAELAEAAAAINRRLNGAGFAMQIADVLPLEETARAHSMVEGGAGGRVVVRIATP